MAAAVTSRDVDRYNKDVLSAGWQKAGQKQTIDMPMELGMIVEEPSTGFTGEIVKWENGVVVLENYKLRRRSFPVGPGFLVEGQSVRLCVPPRTGAAEQKYTASGSRVAPKATAKVALPSRIYVEGRHDAELVEKVWGDDLRHVGVVVEYLGGINDLVGIVAEFKPEKGRRLGVLVDHLVTGSKETRIAREVARGGYGEYVMIGGHRFIDVWQAVKPERIGIKKWPEVPMDVDWKKGTLAALNLPHKDQKDVAQAWQAILKRVDSFRDLDPAFNTEVEKLIDFVTQDHVEDF
ncbi:DUF3097 domain-containing protein [Luteococcus sediminum]